jgi:hypothetical protein
MMAFELGPKMEVHGGHQSSVSDVTDVFFSFLLFSSFQPLLSLSFMLAWIRERQATDISVPAISFTCEFLAAHVRCRQVSVSLFFLFYKLPTIHQQQEKAPPFNDEHWNTKEI